MRRGRPPYDDVLTPREWEVLALLREGLTNEQIAARLGLSENTAKYHVAQILSKLGVSSRQDAAEWQPAGRRAMFGVVAPLLAAVRRLRPAAVLRVAGGLTVLAASAGLLLLAFGAISMRGREPVGGSAEPPLPACDESGFSEPLQPTQTVGTDDAWQLAGSLMPAEVTVYQPTTNADLFGSAQLMEACRSPDGTPQYTVLYRSQQRSLVFILNRTMVAAWGNTPGPPTWTASLGIHCPEHCLDGHLLYTTGTSNGQWFEYYEVSWQEDGYTYQIKLENRNEAAKVSTQSFVDLINGLADLDQPIVAGPTPQRPRPDATALAQLTAIIEHYGGNTPEPPFTGEMNGFVFQADPAPDYPPCDSTEVEVATSEHGSALLEGSGLDFQVGYAPDGYTPDLQTSRFGDTGHVYAGQCGETVFLVREIWSSPSGQLEISRRASKPVLGNTISADRLEATTIGGRPAVIVNPRFEGEEVYIYLRDDHSLWTISSESLSVDELTQVAAGLETN